MKSNLFDARRSHAVTHHTFVSPRPASSPRRRDRVVRWLPASEQASKWTTTSLMTSRDDPVRDCDAERWCLLGRVLGLPDRKTALVPRGGTTSQRLADRRTHQAFRAHTSPNARVYRHGRVQPDWSSGLGSETPYGGRDAGAAGHVDGGVMTTYPDRRKRWSAASRAGN
jgi:hypothetical protein